MSPRIGIIELIFLLGICLILLIVVGLAIFLILRNRPGSSPGAGKMKKCPYCAEYIKEEAVVCRYCRRDQPPMEDQG